MSENFVFLNILAVRTTNYYTYLFSHIRKCKTVTTMINGLIND